MIANLVVGILAVLICVLFQNKKGLKASFFIVTAFLAIRFEWGNDYESYIRWFEEIKNYSLFDLFKHQELSYHGEVLWSVLYLLFKKTGFFSFVIAITIFENWVIYRVIDKHVDPKFYWLSMFIYVLSTETFAVGASMMRQYFCICCYLIVVELMLQRKLWWSILIIVACSFIHRSNIFTLVFLPVFYIKIKTPKLSTSFYIFIALFYLIWNNLPSSFVSNSLSNLLTTVFSGDLTDYYLHYSERKLASINTGLGQIFSFIVFITAIYIIPKASKEDQSIILFFLLSYFLSPLLRFAPMIHRYSLYSVMYTCIIWPMFFKYIKVKPVIITLTACQMIIIIKTFFDFFQSPVWIEHFMHYHTIFEAGAWM
jgi:hypothetical protein